MYITVKTITIMHNKIRQTGFLIGRVDRVRTAVAVQPYQQSRAHYSSLG